MADLEITWRGMSIGAGGDFHIQELTGWDDLPEITSFDTPRSRGHGDHQGDQFARSRIVTASGTIASPTARDELARALMVASPVESSAVEDLTVETFGRALTAGARLVRRSLPIGENYAAGHIPFALQWRCPDPLRYGPAQAAVSTGLPTSGGGLVYPLSYPLSYGTAGNPGQLTLTNAGTAPAPIVFTATPPATGGFEISASGRRLTYPVASAELLTIDTAAGTVLAEGTADRRGYLTYAEWDGFQVPPQSSLTIQFTPLGAYDAGALLSVSGFRSAYW